MTCLEGSAVVSTSVRHSLLANIDTLIRTLNRFFFLCSILSLLLKYTEIIASHAGAILIFPDASSHGIQSLASTE